MTRARTCSAAGIAWVSCSYAGAFGTRSSSDPSIGPYKVSATHEPETLFVEVPAFADFMLRRVVLRPDD